MQSTKLQVKLLSDKATVPMRADSGCAGYDLSSSEDKIIPARKHQLVKTDISIEMPYGVYGRIAPRSGLAYKHGLDIGAGVIDASYRGPIGVIIFNHSDTDYTVKQGDRIAQLVLEVIITPEVKVISELSNTVRQEKGFGSTGK